MPTYSFNTLETTDVAELQIGDRHLRCYVCAEVTLLSKTIESSIVEVQENGEEVEVFRTRVRTPAGSNICDSPKVVGVEDFDDGGEGTRQLFVVHWLEGARSQAPDLFRAYLYPEQTDWEWQDAESIATSDSWLYDVAPVEGGQGYVVTHREDASDFTTMRFLTVANGWAGFEWAVGYTIDHEAAGMLAIYANEGDDTVAFAWEREISGANPNQGEIWCRRMDLDGGNAASWQAMAGLDPSAFVCGGWDRRSTARWGLVVEAKPLEEDEGALSVGAYTEISYVAWQLQNPGATPAAVGGTGRAYHLRLLSRPWARANGLTDGSRRILHAICGFSEVRQSEFGQSSAFVVELPEMDEDFEQRALPSGNLNLRLMDARACGAHPNTGNPGSGARNLNGRRTNHVSSIARPSHTKFETGFTSEAKAYRAALCTFTKLIAIPNAFAASTQPDKPVELVPQQTSMLGVSVHAEEPWIRHRDADDYGSVAQNFKGVYAWHPYQPFAIADMLAIAGGVPQIYDGRQAVEIGWTWYPEIVDISQGDGVSGQLALGEYTYTAIYEKTDDAGHIHRSAPATPVAYDIEDSGATEYVLTINVLCNTLSRRFDTDGPDEHALIKLYRADPGSTVFRLVYGAAITVGGSRSFERIAFNLPDNASIDIIDDVESVATHEVLPWQFIDGQWSPLVPQMPPAASVGWVWRDRMMLVPSEEPNTVWYSMQIKPGPGSQAILAPEFNATNVYRFDAEPLAVTAGIAMDDHSIVWAEDAIYAMTGEFNNDAGFGASLSLTAMHRGVGCIDQRSVVRTDAGVFFQSFRGIEFLDKGWGLSNVTIGSSVEDDVLACGNLHSAEWLEEKRQVRWIGNTAGDGGPIVLVYHYVEQVWTRFTLPEGDQTILDDGDSWMSTAVDACVWRTGGEQLHVVLQQGALLIERDRNDEDLHVDQIRLGTAGNSSDTNSYSGFDIEIGWLSLAGLARYKRVWRVYGLHDPIVADSPGLRLDIDSDIHAGEYPQTGVGTETLTVSAPQLGVSDFRPTVQKVSGMRLRLRRIGSFTTLPTWSILGFALELGLKPGLGKTTASQRGT